MSLIPPERAKALAFKNRKETICGRAKLFAEPARSASPTRLLAPRKWSRL
jgi:hypothetical protein